MGGSSKKPIKGYKYFLGVHHVLCHGPIDKLLRIRIGSDSKDNDGNPISADVWVGENTGGPLTIPSSDNYAVHGDVEVALGAPIQTADPYLVSKLGAVLPAFRHLVSVIYKRVCIGTSASVATPSFRCQRIHVRSDGEDQWYDENSAFGIGLVSGDSWTYVVKELANTTTPPVSEFVAGSAPFGYSVPPNIPGNFLQTIGTSVLRDKQIWLRKVFTWSLTATYPIYLELFAVGSFTVWVNGTQVASRYIWNRVHTSILLPKNVLVPGANTIVVKWWDEGYLPNFSLDWATAGLDGQVLVTSDATASQVIVDIGLGRGYALQLLGTHGPSTSALYRIPEVSDFDMAVKVWTDGAGKYDHVITYRQSAYVSLATEFRYSDGTNYKRIEIVCGKDSVSRLFSSSEIPSASTWTLRIVVEGTSHSVYINSTLMLTLSSTSLMDSVGPICLGSGGSKGVDGGLILGGDPAYSEFVITPKVVQNNVVVPTVDNTWFDAMLNFTGLTSCAEIESFSAHGVTLSSSGWKLEKLVGSTWTTVSENAQAPFASASYPAAPSGYAAAPGTTIAEGETYRISKPFTYDGALSSLICVDMFCLDKAKVVVNGFSIWEYTNQVGSETDPALSRMRALLRNNSKCRLSSDLLANTISIQFTNSASSQVYFDAQVGFANADMNPAHIIRECLLDRYWGKGYAESDLKASSFQSAADTLHSEGMGISILWDKSSSIDAFITSILKHINATLYVEQGTGKFVLKLIRADYDEDSLITLGPSNIEKVSDYNRVAFGDLINTLIVKFWDPATNNTGSITRENPALVNQMGGVVSAEVEYSGFTSAAIAARVGERDLLALSTPLLGCAIYANSVARTLEIGDPFKFEWPSAHAGYIVMRVSTIAYGDGQNNRIQIKCVQDVFHTPETAFISSGDIIRWTDPNLAPKDCLAVLAMEAPYRAWVDEVGQAAVDSALDNDGYTRGLLAVAAAQAADNSIDAKLVTDGGTGGAYDKAAASLMPFTSYGILAVELGYLTTSVQISSPKALSLVTAGSWAQMGQEIVRVDSVDLETNTVTVGRGCLDTVPQRHSAGASVFFCSNFLGSDSVDYEDGETVLSKVLPRTISSILDIGSATAISAAFASRAVRPYAPGNLKINGEYFPDFLPDSPTGDFVLTWAHRDRTQQAAGAHLDFTAGSLGPETGTTYDLLIEGDSGVTLKEETGLTGEEYDFTYPPDFLFMETPSPYFQAAVGWENWQENASYPISQLDRPLLRVPRLVVGAHENIAVNSGNITLASNGTDVWPRTVVRFRDCPKMADFTASFRFKFPVPGSADYPDVAGGEMWMGLAYRTNYWSEDKACLGYRIEVRPYLIDSLVRRVQIRLYRGSDSDTPSETLLWSFTTITSDFTGTVSRVSVVVSGTSHAIYLSHGTGASSHIETVIDPTGPLSGYFGLLAGRPAGLGYSLTFPGEGTAPAIDILSAAPDILRRSASFRVRLTAKKAFVPKFDPISLASYQSQDLTFSQSGWGYSWGTRWEG